MSTDGVLAGATPLDTPTPEAPSGDEAYTPPPPAPGEARDDSALLRPPEWLLLVLRRREDGTYLLVRRRPPGEAASGRTDGAPAGAPTMLSTAPPHPDEGLEAGLASIVRTHLGVAVQGTPRASDVARPARMAHPYTGGPSMGLLRAVALEVSGTPAVDALFASCEALPAAEAEGALATDLERAIFRDGVALLA